MSFASENIECFGPEALGKLASGLAAAPGPSDDALCDAVARRGADLAPCMEAEDLCR